MPRPALDKGVELEFGWPPSRQGFRSMQDTRFAGLRARIKEETTPDHDRLDAAASKLDLTEADDFARFLAMQWLGFRGVLDSGSATGRVSDADLETYLRALEDDLAALGRGLPSPLPPPGPVSRRAIDHIVLGSRLGTAVLKKRWQSSRNPAVLAAARYFSVPGDGAAWRAHVAELSGLSATGADADRTVRDVKQLFEHFFYSLQTASD